MFSFSRKIGKNFAIDVELFTKPRSIKDGLDFIELRNYTNWYRGDHQPSYNFEFSTLNLNIFYLHFYSVNHLEDFDDYDWKKEYQKCFTFDDVEEIKQKMLKECDENPPKFSGLEPFYDGIKNGIERAFYFIGDLIEKEARNGCQK